jgi:hypothetical protein
MEGLFNKVCKGQYSRIPERFSDDLFQVVQFLLQVNSSNRPSCEQILNHPVVLKRIEYFKSFAGEDDNEDKCLLKTIHMPKNLLFLSDKLPKPNYDKQFKSTNNGIEDSNNKNYRSYNKINNNNNEVNKNNVENKDFNNGIHMKKPVKLVPLTHIPEEKEKEKEKTNNNNGNNLNINSKENSKVNLVQINPVTNILGPKSISSNVSSSNVIGNNKIILKKDNVYVLDVLSKQKNDLRKLMLKNNNISRRLNYINNNSQINGSPIKDLNKIFMPNINNKSAPKKINNYKLIKKNYYIHNPPYLKNIEKYQKNANKLDYDYRKNYNLNIINNNGYKNEYLPKLPRRLSPIKKNIPNLV